MPQEVVQLKISVDGYSEANKNLQSLDDLTDKLNSKKIKIDVDTTALKQMAVSEEKRLQLVTEHINAQARLATAQNKVAVEEAKIAQQVEKTAQAQAKAETVEQRRRLLAEQMSAAQDKAARSAENYKNSVDSISRTPLQEQIDALVGIDRQLKSAEESAKALLAAEQKLGNVTGDKIDTGRISTSGMEDYIQNVQKMENATVAATRSVKVGEQTFQQFSISAKNAAGDFDNYTFSVDTATGAVHKLDNGMSTTNKTARTLGQTIGSQIADFIKWSAMAVLVYAPLQALGDAVQELKAVDAELVNIQKVMNATAGEMETLSAKAYEVGSALGIAASDYLASVNKWAQAGYGSLSDELGELSVKTQLVGDVQEETANQFLLSVDAAYQYKGNIEALTRVLDGANEISNNYATSVEKLAGGMGIVSSLAAQAGMEVQETMAAIGTITAVTQESGNSAARALRALILNIQGSTEIAIDEASGERWTEDEIEATAAALGDLNIATREYKDGVEQLRNPMEVIGELSDKYRRGLINEVQLQEVVSSLGGKVRSNQLQALISNYDLYEQMLDTYSESVGSADRELDIYLASWEAKTKRLQNQWVELVDSFKVSDISMGILDIGNALLEIANTDLGNAILQVTMLTAAIIALSAAYQTARKSKEAFNKGDMMGTGKLKPVLTFARDLKNSFASMIPVFKGTATSLSGKTGLAGVLSMLGTTTAGTALAAGAAVAAVALLATAFDHARKAGQRHHEAAMEANADYQTLSDEIATINDQLETNAERLEELNRLKAEGGATAAQIDEISMLNQQNDALELQLEIRKALREEAEKTVIAETRAALDTGPAEAAPGTLGFSDWEESIRVVKASYATLLSEQERLSKAIADGMWPGRLFFAEKDLEDASDGIQNLYETIETWNEQLAESYDAVKDSTAEGADELRDDILTTMAAVQSILQPTQAAVSMIDMALNDLDTSQVKEFDTTVEELKNTIGITAESVQGLAQEFPFLNEIVDLGFLTWEDLANALLAADEASGSVSQGIDTLREEVEETNKETKSLVDTLGGLTSKMQSLADAQDELAKNGELSYDTVLSLMEKVPELEAVLTEYLAGVASEAELQEALGEAYADNADAYQQSILEKMYDNQEFYKNVILTNTDIVAKLADLGITDLENYESIADLKTAVSERFNAEVQGDTRETTNENSEAYIDEAEAYIKSREAMIEASKLTSNRLKAEPENDFFWGEKPTRNPATSQVSSELSDLLSQLDSILNDVIEIPDLDLNLDTDSGGGSAAEKAEDYYQTQIQAMNDLVAYTRDTNTLLEKEDKDSLEKRAQNLTDVLSKINQTANDFRARDLADESEQIQTLKLLWHEVYEERQALYESLYDDLMDTLADQEWELDLFQKNRENADRSVEEIAEDCQKIVSEYKSMQEEVADLAAYYRSLGYDETDDLIQDLSDKWWEYQDNIESVYDALTQAFEDYISESDRQIRALERTTGTAGQQIELYTQRINEARKAIEELQKTNVNGINDDRIGSIQDQIYSDEDAVSGIQEDLWAELEAAVDKEFDKWQDKIDEAQDKLDYFNEKVSKLDEEMQEAIEPLQEQIEEWQDALEDALEPIEERLDELNDRLEAEQEALENLVDPLEKQIEGYYTVNPDGTVGVYVPGLNDQIEDLQDQLDEENRKWDEQQEREEQALALQKKELALQEAIKNLEQAQLDLETAKNERTVYTLKDGVWAWRPDDQAIQEAEDALEDAEQAKEDAEQELEDLKEEQAHDKIVGLLEDQIEALEKQKEQIEAQIEIYEKESEARQDYLQDQIDYWEKEKEAQEDYYNDLIEAHEKEIEAIQDHYEALKAQYDDEIEFWEGRIEELQGKYDAWMEEWEGIQEAIQEPARSIAEILDDIAKYGTPAMKEQVDNITALLRDMGVALDDFNSSIDTGGGSGGNQGGGSGGLSYQETVDLMKQNAQAWHDAMARGDKDTADYYYNWNQELGDGIGADFDDYTGTWTDKYGNPLFTLDNDYSGGGSSSSGRPFSGGSSSSGMSMVEVANRIDELKLQAGTGSMTTKKEAFEEANRLAVSKGALPIEYSPFPNDWYWYDAEGNWLFDKGGVAHGRGVMVKDVEAPELVLSPVLAADVLNPVKNTEFDRFAKDLGIMFGAAQNYTPDTRMERQPVVHNVDSHNVGAIINGVELGENMLDRPLSEILSLLGIHRNY